MIIHDIEQGSEEWYSIRAGIPTASEAGKLITSTGKESKQIIDYAYQLAAELHAGMPLDVWEGNQWTERGKDMEQEAKIAYERSCGVWREDVGFCVSDNGEYGCSPDGFVGDDGLVEIKCLAAKNIVKNMVYFNKHKKAMPDYIPQAQMQLFVTGREWCDLVFYHPELPLLVIRQEKDRGIHKVLDEQIKKCLAIRDEALSVIQKEETCQTIIK